MTILDWESLMKYNEADQLKAIFLLLVEGASLSLNCFRTCPYYCYVIYVFSHLKNEMGDL